MTKYPPSIEKLIHFFCKLQGVGKRSGQRFAFEILNWPEPALKQFGALIENLKTSLIQCADCGSYTDQSEPCRFCDPKLRDLTKICIVSNPKDLYAIEQTRIFNGGYFLIAGLISPLDGRDIDVIDLEKLGARIQKDGVQEIILSLDTTVEGDATSLYIKEACHKWGVKISRLAFGVPLGSSLDYVDGLTLQMALHGRHTL